MCEKSDLTGAVLLITYKRVHHLTKVIESLAEAWTEPYNELHVILHHNQIKVREVVHSINFTKPKILLVDRKVLMSPQEAISRNIFDGLSKTFSNTQIDFVTVLEDDIIVRKDFLDFNSSIISREIHDEKFRGINGFSGAEFELSKDDVYSRFRYGFGWGWTIHRKYWEEIHKIWMTDFETHWDSLLEPHVRLGYVVMPHNSRILNLGFDSSATHTLNGGKQRVALEASYHQCYKKTWNKDFRCTRFEINWRKDVFDYLEPINFYGKAIDQIFSINKWISISENSNYVEKFIKMRTKGLLFDLIGFLSRISINRLT